MFVVKRNGKKEEVKFDKITERISTLSYGMNEDFIVPTKVAQKVCAGLKSGMTTQQLDLLAASISADMTAEHPDYALLAGRISASNLQKTAPNTFSKAMEILYNHTHNGVHIPIISKETYDIVIKHRDLLDNSIDHSLDFTYEIFGFETLKRSYLQKTNKGQIIETPQYMHMRVAIGVHGDDINSIINMYELLSKKLYTHSSPTIFNSGTVHPQMASCFLLDVEEDSIEGIFNTLGESAKISKYAGGIGIALHKVRSSGSYVRGTNGKSTGIIPFLRIFNETARAVNQGGKRKGAISIYLEPHHSDIFEFIDLKRPGGNHEFRCHDLFLAIWTSDLFLQRVNEGKKWTLFDPSTAPGLEEVYGEEYKELYERYESEGKGVKEVNARDLWKAIMIAQIESGVPYIVNKDQANLKSNQKNLGTIKSSNLCVAPETAILTSEGYKEIASLQDQYVDVWNGYEWSNVQVKKTGEDQRLIKVVLSNGSEIECTPYHKFYIETGSRPSEYSKPLMIEAQELKIGQKLIKHELPIIHTDKSPDFKYAYTHGFYCGDGTDGKNYSGDRVPRITLYDVKKRLIRFLDVHTSTYKETKLGVINVQLPLDIAPKFLVPHNFSTKSKLEWLAGYFDSDGTVCKNGTNESIQVASIHKDFLISIMLMLQTMGIQSKVTKNKDQGQSLLPDGKGGTKYYDTKEVHRILINSNDTKKLLDMGLPVKRLEFTFNTPQRDATRFVTVTGVIDEGRFDDTYCFTEVKRGMGMFNGVLTGQCSEILEFTSKDETAVCNLAAIVLPNFVDEQGQFDFDLLTYVSKKAIKNLNKVIDRSFYPSDKSKISNERHRPLALGVCGLHDVFFKMGIDYDSAEARKLNKHIFETIYRGSIIQSIELAKKDGSYQSFKGSPASEGVLQFDMWENFDKESLLWGDWDDIKSQVQKHGLRNSLLTGLMPTASSATISGCVVEAFEIQTSNLYSRKVLSGEFTVINKYLIKDLINLNLWNEKIKNKIMANDGSVQHVHELPDWVKYRYKTVWETSMKTVLDFAADRGPFIDQTQSMNLFMKNPTIPKMTSMYMYGYKKGLKTLCYYLRSRAATEAVKFTVKEEEEENGGCNSCSV